MKILKATQAQYEVLDGFRNKDNLLRFNKDKNDNWIVGKSVLLDDAFIEIREQLNELEEIDFEPIVIEED